MTKSLDVFIVVGEPSGDQLGFKLMRALREATRGAVQFRGIAGQDMRAEGMTSLFPLEDISVMGFAAVARHFPRLYARAWQVIDAVLTKPPDVLVIIDSPDFTHAVAKRVRKRLPHIPVINYAPPSVWAWRPGRASKMRAYVDHVLGLFPFEPEAYRRLHGPPCTYVGHPLIERLDALRPGEGDLSFRQTERPIILALPGSRTGELDRLMPVFGEAFALAAERLPRFDIILPTISGQADRVQRLAVSWPIAPRIIVGEKDKFQAFRRARAALAASGTVTLELALAGVPMVGAYKVSALEAFIARRLVKTEFALLPNLILGKRLVPEFIQEDAAPSRLASSLMEVATDTPARARQIEGLGRLLELMQLPGGAQPSHQAAKIVLKHVDLA